MELGKRLVIEKGARNKNLKVFSTLIIYQNKSKINLKFNSNVFAENEITVESSRPSRSRGLNKVCHINITCLRKNEIS